MSGSVWFPYVWRRWLKLSSSAQGKQRPARGRRRIRLEMEPLEKRLVPAQWSGPIPDGTVWTNTEVQEIIGDALVPTGATLTVEPGTVVKFRSAFSLTVDGTLRSAGTAGKPIVFTAITDDTAGGDTNGDGDTTSPSRGSWGRIAFSPTSTGSLLDHAEVRYGGAFPADTGVQVAVGQLTLTNSVVRDNAGAGLRVVGARPTVRGNTFLNNRDAAVSMDLASDPALLGNTFANNGINGLAVDAGTLAADATWDDSDTVYVLSGRITVAAGKTLTLAAGQVVKGNTGIPVLGFTTGDLLVNGTLRALGTAAQPVVFTAGADDSAGGDTNNDGAADTGLFWSGILFSSTSTGNVLDHVDVRRGGADRQDTELDGTGLFLDRAPLTLTNSVVRSHQGTGLRIVQSNPTVTDTTIQNNTIAIRMDLSSRPTFLGVIPANNSEWNGAVLDPGTLPADTTWDNTGVVYRISEDVTVPAGVTLTLAPGQVVKVEREPGSVAFTVAGRLVAAGTAEAPVIFSRTDDDTAGGDSNGNVSATMWSGLRFAGAGTGLLDHVEVRGAGRFGAVEAAGGAVVVRNSVIRGDGAIGTSNGVVAQAGGTVELSSSLVVDNGFGVVVLPGGAVTAVNNTIAANGIGVDVEGTVTLTNNLITHNTFAGVRAGENASVTMSFNDVFSPVGQKYFGLADQTGVNGNVSVDPKYFNLANGEFQLRGGSPVIDAGTSNGAPLTDFAGKPRYDDPNVVNRGAGAQPFVDLGALERQQTATSDTDLAVTAVSGPAAGLQDQSAFVNWTVTNVGTAPALGEWSDAVYLSPDPVLTPDDVPLGKVRHTGDVGPGQDYTNSGSFTLPGLLPGPYYFLVRANADQEVFEGLALTNNVGASGDTIAMDLPELVVGTPLNGQLPATGAASPLQICKSVNTEVRRTHRRRQADR